MDLKGWKNRTNHLYKKSNEVRTFKKLIMQCEIDMEKFFSEKGHGEVR